LAPLLATANRRNQGILTNPRAIPTDFVNNHRKAANLDTRHIANMDRTYLTAGSQELKEQALVVGSRLEAEEIAIGKRGWFQQLWAPYFVGGRDTRCPTTSPKNES
jgi:hypothetical protein